MGKLDEVLSFAQFSAAKLNSEVTLRQLSNSASFALLALQILSGCLFDEVADGKELDNELELLLTEIIRRRKASSKKQQKQRVFNLFRRSRWCKEWIPKVYCGFLHQGSGI